MIARILESETILGREFLCVTERLLGRVSVVATKLKYFPRNRIEWRVERER